MQDDERVEITFDATSGQDVIFRNSWTPNFQSRQIGEKYFVSNVAGRWSLVSKDEIDELQSVAIARHLFERLEASELILTARNSGSFFKSYEKWGTPHFRHPVHHIVVATLRCNLACTYCHAAVVPPGAGSDYDMSRGTADAILDFALNSRARVQSFEFQGGESLLNKDVLEYMIPRVRDEYAMANKIVYFSIQTNATLLTAKWMDFFRSHGVKVGTSVDGPASVHDAQRITVGGRGSFDSTTRKARQFQLPVLPTITKTSLPYWKQIVDDQLANGSSVVTFQNVYPINSARQNWAQVGISFAEFLQYYDTVVDYLCSVWTDDYYPLERRFVLALKKLVSGRDVDYADFGNPCGMVHSQIAYHTNGDIYTCDEGRDFEEFRVGNVHTDSYDDVVFGPKTRYLKSLSIPNDPECQTCAYRPVCTTCPVYDRAQQGKLVARHAGTDKCFQTKYIYDKLIGWIENNPHLLKQLAEYHELQ